MVMKDIDVYNIKGKEASKSSKLHQNCETKTKNERNE